MPNSNTRKARPVRLYVVVGLSVFMAALLTFITILMMNEAAAEPSRPQSAASSHGTAGPLTPHQLR